MHVALYLFYLLDSTSFRNFQSCFFAEDEIFFSYLSGKTEARACDGNGCDHFFCINIAGKPANVSSISIKLFPYFFLRREVFFFIGKRMRSMRNKGTLLQYGFRFLSRKINHEDCSERSVIQITVFSYIIVGLKAIIAVIFKQIFEMCLPDVQHYNCLFCCFMQLGEKVSDIEVFIHDSFILQHYILSGRHSLFRHSEIHFSPWSKVETDCCFDESIFL